MRLCFDIENDGLYHETSHVWCIVVSDIDTGKEWSFRPGEIEDGLRLLSRAEELWGHNLLGHDLPCLQKLHGWEPPKGTKIMDTLVLTRLCHSDQKDKDLDSNRVKIRALSGSHSLKAWGIRLGHYKGDYGEQENAWDSFSEEMLKYCANDVRLNVKLIRHLLPLLPPPQAVDLEMRTAAYAEECNRRGWSFDVEGARELLATLTKRQDTLREELTRLFPGTMEEMKTPAYWSLIHPDGNVSREPTKGAADKLRKSLGLKPKECRLEPGPPKVKVHEFNPGSRKQIAARLNERYGWVSPELTPKGQELFEDGEGEFEELALEYGQVSEDILESLEYPEVPSLVEYMMLGKRISMLNSGDSAWLKLVSPDGRMRYRLNSIGTVTMRASHVSPNLSQVTGVGKPWGGECRALFKVSEGYKEVGVDLSGIEARLLSHFLYPFDRGDFGDLVLNGDFHQANADNIGLPRGPSKNVFYGWSYGAGDLKLGRMVVGHSDEWKSQYEDFFHQGCKSLPPNKASQKSYRKIGKTIRGRLEAGIKGLPELIEAVQNKSERKGFLSPFDGRRIPVRSSHSALNTLLQGGAAIIAKRWLVWAWDQIRRENLDSNMLIFSHDEVQAEVLPDHVDQHIEIMMAGIKRAEKFYRLNIRLDGEAKVGNNWFECH